MKVGKLNATTVEQSAELGGARNATLVVVSDGDVELSINDNTSYQTYKYGEIIPISESNLSLIKIYYKTLSGTAQVRFWLMG